MRKDRRIELTATPATISYTAIVEAIAEKIKDSGEFIAFDASQLKGAITAAEQKGR